MHKLLLLISILFSVLCTRATPLQEDQESASEVQDTIIYTNPREVLVYDESEVIQRPLNQKQIQDYKNDPDFNYKEALPEDNWWTRFKQKLNELWASFLRWLSGGKEAVGIWAFFVRILPYLLMAGLLALIVYVFMKIDSGNLLMEKIKAPETLLSDDEELIQRSDLQDLIDQALASGNYRLAVRFYYLLVLQKLSGKDLIDWQVQKTNHEYIFEIKDQELRGNFRKVTAIYDYIWYGNFEVDETAFAKAETSFKTINNKL